MLRDFSLRDFGASLNAVESYTNESSQGEIGFSETVNKQKCTHLGMFLASDMNYDSFPVSFILGNVSCPDYNIVGGDYRTFQKWKDDINSKQPILLKDSMGHVWFGSIMNHKFVPDYNGVNYNLYTIKFDFEQTRDMYADNQTRTRIMTN